MDLTEILFCNLFEFDYFCAQFRSLDGCSAITLQFYALQYISMADTAVISFSTPVFVTLIAHLTLGEKCGIVPILTAIGTFCGVAVVTRPPILTGAADYDSKTLVQLKRS